MTARTRRFRRLAAVLAALAAALGLALSPTARATVDPQADRVAGGDRFATAAAVAARSHPSGADTVIVANGFGFADALAGAALAGKLKAPVLLTEQASLPKATSDAITALRARNAVILGGPDAVSPAVQSAVAAKGVTVRRLEGADRFVTAGAVATDIGTASVANLGNLKTAFVANGTVYFDALSGAPLAAEGAQGEGVHPILLVNATNVPKATADAITALGIRQVVILGGTQVVANSVEAELQALTGNPVVRYAGSNRYETAAFAAGKAITDFGFRAVRGFLASGEEGAFPDALAGGPLAALEDSVLLLTPRAALAPAADTFLQARRATYDEVVALGGPLALSDTALQGALDAISLPAGINEALTVDPGDDVVQDNGTTRDYTVTGLGTTIVDVALLPCANVTTAADGRTVFVNANTNTVADGTSGASNVALPGATIGPDVANTAASISAVNGQPSGNVTNNDYLDDQAPSAEGSLTFTVSGPSALTGGVACVVPVVFNDANSDDALNVTATNPGAPPAGAQGESFGAGGATTFGPSGAAAGVIGADVDLTNKGGNSFVACAIVTGTPAEIVNPGACATYTYDANDVFQVNSAGVDLATFEQALSPGDDVNGTYAAAPAGVSTFNLTDESPEAPTALDAAQSGSDVTLTFGNSPTATNADGVTYRAYRVATDRAATTCPAFGSATYSPVATEAGTATTPGQTQLVDRAAPADTRLCYAVVALHDGDESGPSNTDALTTAPAPSDLTVTDAQVTTDAATAGTADAGDIWTVTFSRSVAGTTLDDVGITFTDAGAALTASTGRVDCGPTGGADQAVCTLSADGRTLTVTLEDPPALTTAGLDNAATYPLQITGITAVRAADDGDTPNLGAVSTDTSIDDE